MNETKKSLAEEALDLVMPSIETLLVEKAKRTHVHIVIMDPRKKPWECEFTDAIWYERSITNDEPWERDYTAFARAKANQAWREGQHGIVVTALAPATLRHGDTVYDGSFCYNGVIVACSGVEPYFDMLISAWVALAIQQLSQHQIQTYRAENPNEAFVPTE